MVDFSRLMKMQKFNKSKGNFEFERKIIRDGNNTFRVVSAMPHMAFEHWFSAADKTNVHSICTRDYFAELNKEDPKYCKVCGIVKEAWDVWNAPNDYEEEEVYKAGVIIGQEIDKAKGFKNSWGAKLFAYMNVIDRDSDKCATDKHTLVLSKSEKQAGVTAGTKGIFDEFYEILDQYGDWSDYDIRLRKSGVKLETKYRAYKDKEFDLTEEEKKYEQYDFAELLPPTKDATLERWLTVGVKSRRSTEEDEGAEAIQEAVSEENESVVDVEPDTEKPTKKAAKVETKLVKKKKEAKKEELAECPDCAHMISVDSDSCSQCGAEFSGYDDEE